MVMDFNRYDPSKARRISKYFPLKNQSDDMTEPFINSRTFRHRQT